MFTKLWIDNEMNNLFHKMESDIELRNNRIRVYQEMNFPDRPVIVFLHDSLGCIEVWKDFPEKLARRVNCNFLIYDRFGYGKSDPFLNQDRKVGYMDEEADILIDVLKKCNIENTILFGHSDGGTISLIAASKNSDIIDLVITEGAHVFVEEITLKGIRRSQEKYYTDLKKKLLVYHDNKTDKLFNAWTRTWLSDEFRNWNIENLLLSIICPVLIIQGENDEFGSIRQADAIMNGVSGKAYKFIIPDSGHTPHKESKDVTIKLSSEFIDKYLPVKN